MQLPHIRRAVLAGIAALAVVLPGATPALASTTGTITGRLTTSAGTAAPDVPVLVYRTGSYNIIAQTSTDAQGNYTLNGLAAGSYTVGYQPGGRPEQYHRQQLYSWDADPVTVTAGNTSTVDEQLFATGTITGRIIDSAGDPVPDLRVEGQAIGASTWGSARTDDDGRYEMTVIAGRYRVSFEPVADSYQSQYVPGKIDEDEATVFDVTADAQIVADDTVLPVGNLSGRFTTADGQPLRDADISVYTPNMYTGTWTQTDADGRFDVQLLAGAYRVGLYAGDRQQYYRGQLVPELADLVTVHGGQQTSITDALLGTGALRIRAVDSVTGAPVANFCAHDQCSNGTGTVLIPDLPEGRHDIYLYAPDGRYFPRERTGIRVRADRTAELTIKLRPGAVITTTVVDRQSGAPLRGVCVRAFLAKQVRLPDTNFECSDRSGQVKVGPLRDGDHKLFVVPQDLTYGRQWVGPNGGTGDEREAAVVTATVGAVATAPTVQLDRAGQISGQVTDAQTGAPIRNVSVSVLTGHPGVGAEDARTDDQGHYTLTRLGPYAWPVVFSRYEYATVWSGNAPSRFTAAPVTVTANSTAALDATIGPGVEVTGTVTNTEGTPFRDGFVLAHSVDTGDITGSGWVSDGQLTMRLTGRQRIFLSYDLHLVADGEMHSGRYRVTDPEGVDRLARFTVPATGSLSIDMAIPTS
ncbi:hypothetical protein C1A38_04645 [Verrucosispora sp. ts21]|uniref:carboxypeptidase-like regulatory domain-containing protein n=1 Tax=Verrucosispora sp. ts21 TaxID=2069341 RepID=UPI000C88B0B7|nr:carboxypeptidase-like regulatory domain-containing protein [Verrucosispora sp. ts21]PMR62279.1 hypothetical protein C1A38_04645 [Verrucosispora sp. ts21]